MTVVFQRLDGWNRVYFGTDTRAFAILAGAAVAAAAVRFPSIRTSWRRPAVEVLGLFGGLVLLAAWFRLDGGSWSARHGGLAACSVAGALVIAAVSSPDRGVLARLVSFAPLRWLGLISYGVYLYHWPIIVWLDSARVGFGGWRLIALQGAVTLAVAAASYRFVEQPIRHGSGWPRRVNVLVPATGFAAVALVVLFATVGYRPLAASEGAASGTTVPSDPTGTRIMVIGNSVAYFLGDEGVPHLRSTPQFALLNRGRIACAYPGSDSFKDPSGQISDAFIHTCDDGWMAAARTFKPDLVIYTRDGISPMAIHHDGDYIDVCSTAFHDWYTGLLEADAKRFAKLGAKLVLVTAPPAVPVDGARASRARYLASVGCGNRVLHDVAASLPGSVRLVDLEAHLCTDDGTCAPRGRRGRAPPGRWSLPGSWRGRRREVDPRPGRHRRPICAMSDPSARPRIAHLTALDGLRGVAVAVVVLFHVVGRGPRHVGTAGRVVVGGRCGVPEGRWLEPRPLRDRHPGVCDPGWCGGGGGAVAGRRAAVRPAPVGGRCVRRGRCRRPGPPRGATTTCCTTSRSVFPTR